MSGSFAPPTNQLGDINYTTPTLLNGWTTYAGYTPGYKRLGNGVVSVRGVLQKNNPASTEVLFNFPSNGGYRHSSAADLFFSCNLVGDGVYRSGFFSVTSGGDVIIYLPATLASVIIYLSSLRFEAL